MKISIIIPVFNEEKYIGLCLDSLLTQSKKVHEIIIVNNASTDKSVKVIKSYLSRLPIKLVTEKRKGIRFAFTTAITNCTADLILRTDADCILPQDWVMNYYKHFRSDPNLAAAGGFFKAADGPQSLRLLSPIGPVINLLPLAAANKCLVLYGGNMAIRKKILSASDLQLIIDSPIREDVYLSSLLWQRSCKYRYFVDCWGYTSSRRFDSIKSTIHAVLANLDPKYYHEKSS